MNLAISGYLLSTHGSNETGVGGSGSTSGGVSDRIAGGVILGSAMSGDICFYLAVVYGSSLKFSRAGWKYDLLLHVGRFQMHAHDCVRLGERLYMEQGSRIVGEVQLKQRVLHRLVG